MQRYSCNLNFIYLSVLVLLLITPLSIAAVKKTNISKPINTVTIPSNKPAAKSSAKPTNPAPTAPPQHYLAPVLNMMEQSVLGRNYPKETASKRIERLEELVYGQTKPNLPQEQRLAELAKTITPPTITPITIEKPQPALQPQQPIQQSSPRIINSYPVTPYAPNPVYTAPNAQTEPATPTLSTNADRTVSPEELASIELLEQKLYRRNYPQDGIEARISRMEMTVFSEAAPEMTDEDRLMRIASVAQAQQTTQQEQIGQQQQWNTSPNQPRIYGPSSGRSNGLTIRSNGNGGQIMQQLLWYLLMNAL